MVETLLDLTFNISQNCRAKVFTINAIQVVDGLDNIAEVDVEV